MQVVWYYIMKNLGIYSQIKGETKAYIESSAIYDCNRQSRYKEDEESEFGIFEYVVDTNIRAYVRTWYGDKNRKCGRSAIHSEYPNIVLIKCKHEGKCK